MLQVALHNELLFQLKQNTAINIHKHFIYAMNNCATNAIPNISQNICLDYQDNDLFELRLPEHNERSE